MGDIKIKIYSHQDQFIDFLYDSGREFEGQLFSPQMKVQANGQKQLTFSMPLRFWSKTAMDFIDNPRWNFLTAHYKIRVIEDNEVNEFVMQSYTESRTESDEIIGEVTCKSLAEFELSQVGYSIVLGQDNLYIFVDGEDPNDPDSEIIGAHDATIDFWQGIILENSDWSYVVECYYEPEEGMPIRDSSKIYEDNYIIGYTDDNEPIYGTTYIEKQRIIEMSKSNLWNLENEICEKFRVWPEYRITYENPDGAILSKTIVFRNEVPDDSLFTIRYSKNEKSIQRTGDSSQVVTKMYVNNLTNEDVDAQIISIADCEANFMRENYLLDLEWYLGDATKEDVSHEMLIDPNMSLTFAAETTYAKVPFDEETVIEPHNIIQKHKEKIRNRNFYLEDKYKQKLEDEDQYIDLKAEKEYKQSHKDAAQETYNSVAEEWALCPQEPQLDQNFSCYAYDNNGDLIVSFRQKGIKDENIQRNKVLVYPDSLVNVLWVDNNGNKHEVESVNDLSWTIYEREPITGCVTAIKLIGQNNLDGYPLVLGNAQTYARFNIDLTYNPLYFYTIVKDYWAKQIEVFATRITALGLTPEEGGVYDEQKQVWVDGDETISYNGANWIYTDSEGLFYICTKEGETFWYIPAGATEPVQALPNSKPSNQLILRMYTIWKQDSKDYYNATLNKEAAIASFEAAFRPYIRDGYWEDTDYGSYSDGGTKIEGAQPIRKPFYNESVNNTVWDKHKICFKVPNVQIGKYHPIRPRQSGETAQITETLDVDLYLYDIIDIDTIEVMTNNPANEYLTLPYKNYVRGTDFSVVYGYTADRAVNSNGDLLDENGNVIYYEEDVLIHADKYDSGIYLMFESPEAFFRASDWAITADTALFIRAKARGTDNYIYAGYVSPKYRTDDRSKTQAYCDMVCEIAIQDSDIILSDINVKVATGQVNYKITDPAFSFEGGGSIFVANLSSISPIQNLLEYGHDYTLRKERINDLPYVIITFIPSTNFPYLTGAISNGVIAPAWINYEYKKDITAQFYYHDASENFNDFKIPQVSYEVSVLDISKAIHPDRDYSHYKPIAGTRVPIYDKEMHFDGLSGFINAVTYNLFEPQNTTIEITSYKDKFEDLFQKITTATVAIQSKEYAYDKTINIIGPNGDSNATINENVLQNSLTGMTDGIQVDTTGLVRWDKTGIILTEDIKDGIPGQIKLSSNGISISREVDEDNNYKWTPVLTADGLNASTLTAGHLDINSLSIWNKNEPRFNWDATGIYAYGNQENGLTDYNSFVVFNADGLKFRELVNFSGLSSIKLENQVVSQNLSSWSGVDEDDDILDTIIDSSNYGVTFYPTYIDATPKPCQTMKIMIPILEQLTPYHTYYYRYTLQPIDLPEDTQCIITTQVGKYSKTQNLLDAQTDTNELENEEYIPNNFITFDGTVDSIENNEFTIVCSLTQKYLNWGMKVKEIVFVDIHNAFAATETTGIALPDIVYLNNLPFNANEMIINTEDNTLQIYKDTVKLGWSGLEIYAQDGAVGLTSNDGLFVNEVITENGEQIIHRMVTLGKFVVGHSVITEQDEYGYGINIASNKDTSGTQPIFRITNEKWLVNTSVLQINAGIYSGEVIPITASYMQVGKQMGPMGTLAIGDKDLGTITPSSAAIDFSSSVGIHTQDVPLSIATSENILIQTNGATSSSTKYIILDAGAQGRIYYRSKNTSGAWTQL